MPTVVRAFDRLVRGLLNWGVVVGCWGAILGSRGTTRDPADDCAAVMDAKEEVSVMISTARAFAEKAWSGPADTATFWCDRMTAMLYRVHGFSRGYDAAAYVSGRPGRMGHIINPAAGSISFDLAHAQCVDPGGLTEITQSSTDEAPSTSRTLESRQALTEHLRDVEMQLMESVSYCAN